jgi:hypothetical protein
MWRDNVDPTIKNYLEALIKSTITNKEAIDLASNKGNAQLWMALSILYKQSFNLDQRIKYIEKLLKDIIQEINELKEKKENSNIIKIKNPKKK